MPRTPFKSYIEMGYRVRQLHCIGSVQGCRLLHPVTGVRLFAVRYRTQHAAGSTLREAINKVRAKIARLNPGPDAFSYLEIVTLYGDVVRRFDITARSRGQRLRLRTGIERTLDLQNYYTNICSSPARLPVGDNLHAA